MSIFSELFEYSEESPSGLKWKVERKGGKYNAFTITRVGDNAGHLKAKTKYYVVKINGKVHQVHRVIFCLFNEDFEYTDIRVVDHIDGKTQNNKISNLRCITTAENNRNRKVGALNKSGTSAVYFLDTEHPGWRASIRDEHGKRKTKYFSIGKYGDKAKDLAVKWRLEQIKALEEKGIFYTFREII